MKWLATPVLGLFAAGGCGDGERPVFDPSLVGGEITMTSFDSATTQYGEIDISVLSRRTSNAPFPASGACEPYLDDGDYALPEVDLGAVAIDGSAISPVSLELGTTDDLMPARYSQATRDGGPLFHPGDLLTVTTDGGELEGFTDSVVAPEIATITSPTRGAGPILIDATTGLTLTWTGVTRGDVLVRLFQTNIDYSYGVTCRFPAAAGTATVVPTSDLHGDIRVTVRSLADTRHVVEGIAIELQAIFAAVDPGGGLAGGSATVVE